MERNDRDRPEGGTAAPARKPAAPRLPPRPSPFDPTRLNRFIAQAGICSRRDADQLILRGEITVNGEVVTELGRKIVPRTDKVEYKGKVLESKKYIYILLNKPKNTITTTEDPEGRQTVLEAIHKATRERVFPVGRLDRNTTGLLLLTNDGELTEKMTHPSYKVKKVYYARLSKDMLPEDMQKLVKGVELEDGLAQVDKIDYVDGGKPNEIGLEIHIGRNRIVRRMMEHIGYEVTALDRVSIGHLTKKNLPRGHWRILSEQEVAFLKMM